MADRLDSVAEELAVRCPESIQLRTGSHAHAPVIHIVEAVCGICHDLLLLYIVPSTQHFLGIHAVCKVERRCDIDVIENGEVRLHRDCMLKGILPVLEKVGMQQPVFLGGDGIGQLAGIAHRNLLIPPVLAHSVPALERIETAQTDVQVGQRHLNGRVAHILRQIGRSAQ